MKYDLSSYLLEGMVLPAILGTLLLRKIQITGALVINCNMIMSTCPTSMNAIIRMLYIGLTFNVGTEISMDILVQCYVAVASTT